MSRHRDRVDLHYGQDDFADRDKLIRTLARSPALVRRGKVARALRQALALFKSAGADLAKRLKRISLCQPLDGRARRPALRRTSSADA